MPPTPAPRPSPTPSILVRPAGPLTADLFDLIGVPNSPQSRLLALAVELALLIALSLLARRLMSRLVRRMGERFAVRNEAAGAAGRAARVRTLTSLTRSGADFMIGFVFLVSALSALGVNIAAIVGTASVAGLAFGFGAQKLVKDVITGFFLLLEDQYAVGDYITVGAVSGTVEELGMRITRLRDDDGKLHTLSNGDVAQVCNHSRAAIAGSFEIAIAAKADIGLATAALNARLATLSAELALPVVAQVEGIAAADATRTTLRIAFRAPIGQRPAAFLLALRGGAVAALTDAGVALG